jgi:DNA invertase Pin-like site-specific DNA recombinase
MTPRTAVLYARVSSREQREEGFSIEAQVKLLRASASKEGFEIVREFIEVESAKVAGRKKFAEMVTFFKRNRTCRILLVEKTDRLYRNQRDALTLEDLDIRIHFVKENETLSKDAKSQVKFMHDIRLAMARNYSENLREEVKKGMAEKASQGTYPGRAPFGYRNDTATRTIEIHPERAEIARHVFDLYASGRFSLLALSKELRHGRGTSISKTNLHKMLTNPFYIGRFEWSGQTYQGTHPALISPEVFGQVQAVLSGHNRPRYGKHEMAFRGMLTCAHDDCAVTAELKKNKYVYYRCTGYRGKCALPRFREEEIAERMGHVLQDVSIPEEVAQGIEASLRRVQAQMRKESEQNRARLERELTALRTRMDAAYIDKLDGRISAEFWQRKQADWQSEEFRIQSLISGLTEDRCAEKLLDVQRILELAQRAYFLYLTRKPAEQAGLLKMVLLNCSIDAVSLYPTYRKPFDVIFNRVKNKEWSGRRDSNPRPCAPKTSQRVYGNLLKWIENKRFLLNYLPYTCRALRLLGALTAAISTISMNIPSNRVGLFAK